MTTIKEKRCSRQGGGVSIVSAVLLVMAMAAMVACSDGDSSPAPQPFAPPPASAQQPPAPPPVMQPAEPPVVQPVAVSTGRGSRLAAVRTRGTLICAAPTSGPGFGVVDESGNAVGFDIDLCRAVATAVLGTPDAIEIREILPSERGPVMQAGEVDLLAFQTTWTTLRDAEWGDFAPTMFYDGQGFMVKRGTNISSAMQLSGATVCVAEGTTTQVNLQDFSVTNSLNIIPVTFPDFTTMEAGYLADMCTALTSDISNLASRRINFPDRDAHVLLPETISEEPLGPSVPHGDGLWFDIVKTVMSMLIYAEAYGVTSTTVPTTLTGDVKVDRLFGLDSTYGQTSLGLNPMAAQAVIRAVGNYGEIYDRHLGPAGLGMPRENSRNALWADAPCTGCPKGGQVYAAPPQ